MVYGYARASTTETKQDIERQVMELRAMGAEIIFKEYESGLNTNREELESLLSTVKEGDTIYTTEVSRISRSTRHLCDIIEIAKEKKLKFVFGSFIVDCTSSMDAITECLLKMMAVIAEFERNMTVERINSGLRAAKAKGIKFGRPAFKVSDIPEKVHELYPAYLAGTLSKKDYASSCDISRPTLNKYLAVISGKND